MKARAKAGEPIRTWGGREYYCEAPRFVDGRLQEYDYKLVNVLIQGSAADVTKEALIRYCDAKPKHHRVLMTVHDELVTSVPCDEREAAMAQLREAMESVKLDVPLLSDGSWSPKSWADLKEI
jgi:DNA polymerase I-like protein with 3'-5' exonuclease and polymerase domains